MAAHQEGFSALLPYERTFQPGFPDVDYPAWASQKRTLQLCKTCPEECAKLRNTTFLLLGLLQLDLPASQRSLCVSSLAESFIDLTMCACKIFHSIIVLELAGPVIASPAQHFYANCV